MSVMDGIESSTQYRNPHVSWAILACCISARSKNSVSPCPQMQVSNASMNNEQRKCNYSMTIFRLRATALALCGTLSPGRFFPGSPRPWNALRKPKLVLVLGVTVVIDRNFFAGFDVFNRNDFHHQFVEHLFQLCIWRI